MQIHRETLERETAPDTDIHDLTDEVRAVIERSGVKQGQVLVFTPGSTAGVTVIEYESGAVADLRRAIDRLAPTGERYDHDARWGDGNGYSHVRAALLGPSITAPIVDGRAVLGTWQQIILCDFDNRPRTRKIVVQVMGVVVP